MQNFLKNRINLLILFVVVATASILLLNSGTLGSLSAIKAQFNLNTIVVLISALGIIFYQFRLGSAKVSSEVIQNYQILEQQLKQKSTEQDNKIIDLSREISNLTGKLDEKDKHIKTLTDLVTNRNPELDIFIKTMTTMGLTSQKYMERNDVMMAEIRNFMQSLHTNVGASSILSKDSNNMLHYQKERDTRIDNATGSGEGNPLRMDMSSAPSENSQ